MEPDRWQEVEAIYLAAIPLSHDERDALLTDACAGDDVLRNEVESLLKYGDSPDSFLEKPAMECMAEALAGDLQGSEKKNSARMIGTRIAQYRIIEKLGSGGMGDVYRAVRADDQFEMQVAIKLVRQGLGNESVEARFRRERQILAGLDHENIARLLDGGTTNEGRPYFVMELVEGKPIDEYCDQARLETGARLALFCQVCSAVQYAHQRLVVHRDIKPSNILVTAAGVPKLLDFGIATLLTPETVAPNVERTETVLRMMTPLFASPEQLHGQLITTATDVYSLGVVLYKLLTGRMPYRLENSSPFELAQAICETAPEKPSSAIVRPVALAQETVPAKSDSEPAVPGSQECIETASSRRGVSPEKLRRTLSGDLDQIILKALRKEPERRYASVREFAEDLQAFLRGLPVTARPDTFVYRSGKFIRRNRVILAITVAFFLLGLVGVAVIVREAQVARLQQARAERRFNDLRSLANSLLFEIDDSISNLPGSTAARKLLVDRALLYLDSLSRESSGTPGLERELATAYEKVGDVQGNPYFANLGDTAGAIASYRKALNLRLALADDNHGSYDDREYLVGIYMKLGLGLEAASNFASSLDSLRHAYPIAKALAEEHPNDPRAQENFAGVSFMMASTLSDTGDLAASMDYYLRSAAIRESIKTGPPELLEQVQTRLAGVYGYLAGDLNLQGDLDSAIALQRKARDILARLSAADPQNARLQQFVLESEYWMGYYLAEKGLSSQALPHLRAALAGYRKLTEADAHDVLAQRYLGKCYVGVGSVLSAMGKPAAGIEIARRAVQIFDSLAAADQADNYFKPPDMAYARSALADAYEHMALTPGISEAAKIADWRKARTWYQASLDTWLQLKKRAPLGQFDAKQPDKIAKEVAKCDASIAKLHADIL